MKRNRKSRSIHPRTGADAEARDADRPVPPTPATVARLRTDVIEGLYQNGRLLPEHVRAAREVRRIWEGFGRALMPSAQTLSATGRSKRITSFRDPIDRLSLAEEVAWRVRYRPWAQEMSHSLTAGALRVTRLQLTLDIAVDNHGLRQIEGWYRMRHGAALGHLRGALHRYAEIAQWVEPDPE